MTTDFPLAGAAAGDNLANRFRPRSAGVWALPLDPPVAALARGRLTVQIQDAQGNTSRIVRTISVAK